jgi:NAD(P)-dependent dehydrogenase (short-subunit alcohol dehydrogenase family)
MSKSAPKKKQFPKQQQPHPGLESEMQPEPVYMDERPGSGKLLDRNCLITGGDSGIGRATAIAFAKEGANVAIVYLSAEEADAQETAEIIGSTFGRKVLLIEADLGKEKNCIAVAKKIRKKWNELHVLVNNAGMHYPEKNVEKIDTEKLVETFSVNVFAMFWLVRELVGIMPEKSAIVNTTSVTAYRGSAELLDYSATKGAIVTFTRSLSANLAERKIRVNAVAPGPIWTPLIPASFDNEKVQTHGSDTPLKRAGQPVELAPAYVFLACEDSSYITGQVIHVNGGEIING